MAEGRRDGEESVKLFVGQVPKQMTETQVVELFEQFAVVDQVNIIKDKITRASRGCCFVICPSREEADKAVNALHNKKTLPGAASPLQVKYADGELERLEHKLFVGMLPKNVTELEVSDLFSPYGDIKDLQILRGSQQTNKGCAFLKYETKEQALAAIEALNGNHRMEGSSVPLVVKWADTEKERLARRAQKAQSQPLNMANTDSPQHQSLFGALPMGYMSPYNGYGYQLLYAGNRNTNAWTALIAAEYCGVKFELVKDFQMGFSEKTPEFLKMNPMGKVPVLETPDGTVFGSNAIARYVTKLNPESSLFGSSPVDYGHVEQWIDFTALEIDANIASCLYPRYGFAVYLPLAEEAAIAALKRALGGLNTHLASTTYLVGHSVTLADIVLACNLATGFKEILTKSFTSEFPHVERYFWTMVNQPNFSKIMGKLEQAETRTINDLSTELIGEILKRLPVKYILRCSSMKKSWYDFIRSPHFNKLHMNHQLASPGDGFLFFKTVSRNSHNIRRDNVGCELYCEFPCSSPYPEELHQKIWCEHSNGILCITYPNEWYASCKIHLFNPVVNKHKTLPGPPIALQSTPLWHALAFGYIPAVDDYCVVCITKPRGKSNSLSISVYNLRSNSWRNFQQDLAIIDIDSDHSFFVNNVAYWLGNSLEEGVQLVCFDTTSDTLQFLDLPDELPGDGFGNFGRMKGARGWKYRHVIRSTGQSVAYFHGTLHWDTLYVHVLGDYDIWELKFNVALNGILIREKVLGIRKNGDLILRESDGLVTVDLVNQVRTEFFDLRQLERRPNAAASPTLINPFMENLLFFDEPKKEAAKPRVEEAPEEEAPKAKAGKALDALPPSKMILDEWKRLYSNTKTNFRETVKGFWDMFDPEGYSLWFCKYKYNEENMVSSVTLNKVGGFLQSMDLAREYAFGKMLVIGSQPPYKVWGLWLFLGKDIPQFVMDECHDMKLYEWTQVDINDEAQKERASQMIEAQESFEGDDLLETKCFK